MTSAMKCTSPTFLYNNVDSLSSRSKDYLGSGGRKKRGAPNTTGSDSSEQRVHDSSTERQQKRQHIGGQKSMEIHQRAYPSASLADMSCLRVVADLKEKYGVLMKLASSPRYKSSAGYFDAWLEENKENSSAISFCNVSLQTLREMMCEWSYRVVDQCGITREVVAISMSYFDRFMSRLSFEELRELEENIIKLIMMTTLNLAVKNVQPAKYFYNSILSPCLQELELHSEHLTVNNMEMRIIQQLDWALSPPTPQAFARLILKIPSFDVCNSFRMNKVEILDLTCFLIELPVYSCFFIDKNPSHIALAALQIALERYIPNYLNEMTDTWKVLRQSFGICLCDPGVEICYNQLLLDYTEETGGEMAFKNNIGLSDVQPSLELTSPVVISNLLV